MEKSEIYDVISDKCTIPIDTSCPFQIPTSTELAKSSFGENREIQYYLSQASKYLSSYYQKVLGWLPANPSKKDIVDAIKEVYVFSEAKSNTANNVLNTKEGHANFITYLTTKNNSDTIIIRGPKGSGKTFYLNYLLNTESQNLYDSGYVWYRADLSKLYRHNIFVQKEFESGTAIETREYTLLEYFCVHIVYVSYKYQRNMDILKEFWEDYRGITSNLITEKWLANPKYQEIAGEPDKIIDSFHEFVERAGIERDLEADVTFSKEVVEEMLWSNSDVLTSEILAELLILHLKKQNVIPLLIVDGLDNINFYRYEKYYNYMWDQIRKLCLKDDKPNKWNAKYLISLRNETFQDIRSTTLKYYKNENIPVFTIKHTNAEAILNTKIETTLLPRARYFKDKKVSSHDMVKKYIDNLNRISNTAERNRVDYHSLIQKTNVHFKEFGEGFLGRIIESIKEIIPGQKNQSIDVEFLINSFYNKNMRAFLCNFINMFNYYLLYEEKSTSISKNKTYVISEGQLLNGGLYLDTQNNIYEFGKCIPNIFWFDKTINCKKWHGLTNYRILQMLKHNSITEKNIIEALSNNFGYEIEIIRASLMYCVAHGFITFIFNEMTEERDISITDKGLLLMDYFFYDLHAFYIVALDTPISSALIHDRSTNIIRYHIHDEDMFWREYIEACILSSISFIRYINTQNNNELSALDSNKGLKSSMFSLPDLFPNRLIEQMSNLVFKLKNFRSSHRYEELINDLQGII